MIRVLTFDSRLDGCVTDTESLSERSRAYPSSRIEGENFGNLLGRKLESALSEAKVVAVFLDHVGGVVLGSPKEKMRRVYAMPNIAPVKNKRAIRDLSNMQLP